MRGAALLAIAGGVDGPVSETVRRAREAIRPAEEPGGTLTRSGDPDAQSVTACEAGPDENWSATIDRVRFVAAQVRKTDERARSLVRSAQVYMQRADQRVREMEERVGQADRAMQSLDEYARATEARAHEAEVRLKSLLQQFEAAEARAQPLKRPRALQEDTSGRRKNAFVLPSSVPEFSKRA
jgi:hypothetical protein